MTTALPELELYAFWRSSAAFRVRVALNLKGLVAREHFVDIDGGAQRSSDFLRINPLGGVPALRVAGRPPLTQSLAILEYLDELVPSPPLLPAEPYARARVRAIAAMLASDTHPLVTPRVKKYLTATGAVDDAAWRAWQTHWFGTGLTALEQHLTGDSAVGRFIHGDAPTTADICLASIAAVMRVFEIGIPNLPTIERVLAACDAHPAFARAEPRLQEGAPKVVAPGR